MSELTFRDYDPSDLPMLKAVVGGCWGRSFFVGDPVYDDLITLNFSSIFLEESNRSRVALLDGRAVGFVLGHVFSEPLWSGHDEAHSDRVRSALSLSSDSRSLDYLDYYDKVLTLYREALRVIGRKFDSEIVLLAVDPNCRGLGIGRALIDEIVSVMRSDGVKDTFLFTSGLSDHDFYSHLGFELVVDTYMAAGGFGNVGVYVYARTL